MQESSYASVASSQWVIDAVNLTLCDSRASLLQSNVCAEGVSGAYVYSLLRLPWLAPDITTAIVNGRNPRQLTAKKLMRLTAHLPVGWAEQRKLLGFR